MPPTSHPQAKFDPLPPDLDLGALVEKTPNFDYVIRVSKEQIEDLGLAEFEKLVLLHVVIGGKPLVVEGYEDQLPPWIFSAQWLLDNVAKKEEMVRDIGNASNMPMTIGHYVNAMEKLTRQWTPDNFREAKRQRLYLKDVDCPPAWHTHLEKIIPSAMFYMNETVGEQGGPGARTERNQYNQITAGKGIAIAGDLMSNLPQEMRALNMMCYIGHEGTYTPAHREMCATLGQNIMVETSDYQKAEKPGTSIWFMTESKDRQVVSEYFLSMLGHDIEVEAHFAQINAWKKAPFPVYVVEQRVGDFLLIPPLAPHQVWNRGTRTMKAAWNRTTIDTLELALHEALPNARMVCRDEQYKCKAIVYYSLLNYAERLNQALAEQNRGQQILRTSRIKQLRKDFRRLFDLFTEILVSEMFSSAHPVGKSIEFVEFDSNITCSYCRCNIFNRFLTCKSCVGELVNGDEDTYDICLECYAMGRSCGCISNLTWVEQWKWSKLIQSHNVWRSLIVAFTGHEIEKLPRTIEIARELSGKKPVAQICQEQLKLRPWHDINQPQELGPEAPAESEEEPQVDDEGRLKKKRKSAQRRKGKKNIDKADANCHICLHRDWKWKLAFCSKCNNAYCYGTLWRAFDLKPQDVMANPAWECPRCVGICSCGKCRKIGKTTPYRPKGTLLGHDTKKVADPRSVESLVDFSRANLGWLRGEGDHDPKNSLRMKLLKEKAQEEKDRDVPMDDDHADHAGLGEDIAMDSEMHNGVDDIDPTLRDDTHVAPATSQLREDSNESSILLQPVVVTDEFVSEPGLGLAAPVAVMIGDESDSMYPDPSMASSRIMGQGYYQQTNGADRILFDHPDISTPGGEHPNTTYPRLPSASISTKRKRDFDTPSGHGDAAREEYLQAQKKQKLNEAKKANKFYATQHQLTGRDETLMVKLPLHNKSAFLHGLANIGSSTPKPRLNTRPARTVAGTDTLSATKSGFDESSFTEDAIVVVSDIAPAVQNSRNSVKKGVYQEISEDDDEHAGFVDLFVPPKPRSRPAVRSERGLPKQTETVVPLPQAAGFVASESDLDMETIAGPAGDDDTVLQSVDEAPRIETPDPAPRKKRGRPKKAAVLHQSSILVTSRPESPVDHSLSSPIHVPSSPSEHEPQASPVRIALSLSRSPEADAQPLQIISSPSSASEIEDVLNELDEDWRSDEQDPFDEIDAAYQAIRGPPALKQHLVTKPVPLQPNGPNDYRFDKLEAFRQIEEEIAQEQADAQNGKTSISATATPTSGAANKKHEPIHSMGERRAPVAKSLRGADLETTTVKFCHQPERSAQGRQPSGDSSSSDDDDDDDEGIPAQAPSAWGAIPSRGRGRGRSRGGGGKGSSMLRSLRQNI